MQYLTSPDVAELTLHTMYLSSIIGMRRTYDLLWWEMHRVIGYDVRLYGADVLIAYAALYEG